MNDAITKVKNNLERAKYIVLEAEKKKKSISELENRVVEIN